MSTDLLNLKEKVIVITGGTGRLGSVYCQSFLELGAQVVTLDLKPSPLLETVGRSSGRLTQISADVSDRNSVEAALSEIRGALGVPSGLINNAALDSPPNSPAAANGPFENYPSDAWDEIMRVNVRGVVVPCQIIGGAMAAAGRGSIVNIASTYGMVSPDQRLYDYRRERGEEFYKPAAYSASKSALYNLTRYLATYWGGHGVRVNTLTLGGVYDNQEARFVEEYSRRTPLGRMAQAKEYVGPLAFLLSDCSSYVTGSNLVADGGWTAW